ncbi:uncharacterized protein LOC118146898 [Callithrix jacchus]|uniref:translation initiation factor IF-2-like isoform X2 n=1 Tax=Callithrix jacchus TaxID=9483 RepID=UPI00159F6E87|nr:translation initiation factor IF-2-like isoform X2 [Callithrix jacchus]
MAEQKQSRGLPIAFLIGSNQGGRLREPARDPAGMSNPSRCLLWQDGAPDRRAGKAAGSPHSPSPRGTDRQARRTPRGEGSGKKTPAKGEPLTEQNPRARRPGCKPPFVCCRGAGALSQAGRSPSSRLALAGAPTARLATPAWARAPALAPAPAPARAAAAAAAPPRAGPRPRPPGPHLLRRRRWGAGRWAPGGGRLPRVPLCPLAASRPFGRAVPGPSPTWPRGDQLTWGAKPRPGAAWPSRAHAGEPQSLQARPHASCGTGIKLTKGNQHFGSQRKGTREATDPNTGNNRCFRDAFNEPKAVDTDEGRH